MAYLSRKDIFEVEALDEGAVVEFEGDLGHDDEGKRYDGHEGVQDEHPSEELEEGGHA